MILSNTGIALLAYMDGVAQTRTLGGVVLAAASAAASATYKVKKTNGMLTKFLFNIFYYHFRYCSREQWVMSPFVNWQCFSP